MPSVDMDEETIRRIARIVLDEIKVPLAEEMARVILHAPITGVSRGTIKGGSVKDDER